MKYTFEQKVESVVESSIKVIRQFQKNGYAPIVMVFSHPEDPQHCHIRTAGGIDAKEFIKWLAESDGGIIQ